MSYAVPTHRIVVDLLFAGRAARRGALFTGEHRDGAEALATLLEGDHDFLPFVDGEVGGTLVLVHRDAVAQVIVREVLRVDEEALVPPTHRITARIALRDGAGLTGVLQFTAPSERGRLSDHLNARGRFLRVTVDRTLHFVAKCWMESVAELSPPDIRLTGDDPGGDQ